MTLMQYAAVLIPMISLLFLWVGVLTGKRTRRQHEERRRDQ